MALGGPESVNPRVGITAQNGLIKRRDLAINYRSGQPGCITETVIGKLDELVVIVNTPVRCDLNGLLSAREGTTLVVAAGTAGVTLSQETFVERVEAAGVQLGANFISKLPGADKGTPTFGTAFVR